MGSTESLIRLLGHSVWQNEHGMLREFMLRIVDTTIRLINADTYFKRQLVPKSDVAEYFAKKTIEKEFLQ